MTELSNNGLIHIQSTLSVADTLSALEGIVLSRGIDIVTRIDHARAAARAGLSMRPTQLLILGSPAAGTPLMLASPSAAIDLPLKVLAWEDADGRVWLSYNAPRYLQQRHGFPEELIKNIEGLGSMCEEAVRARS